MRFAATITVTKTSTRFAGQDDAADWLNALDTSYPDEIEQKMNGLGVIRCKYPGLCALNFEMLLDVLLDKLVGDNPSKTGIFGILEAFALAVEEQGRKTLHGHILVYIKHWNDLLHKLHSLSERTRAEAEAKIQKLVDSVVSTELTPSYLPNGNFNGQNTDNIPCPSCDKESLQYPTDQQLRI